MSYFEQKEWKARLAEFIGRRKLTRVSDGATELYDVTREEGHISQEGDPFSPANMNGLEQRVANGFVKVGKDIETINSDLGGFHPIIDPETGRVMAYKTKVGADAVFPFSNGFPAMCYAHIRSGFEANGVLIGYQNEKPVVKNLLTNSTVLNDYISVSGSVVSQMYKFEAYTVKACKISLNGSTFSEYAEHTLIASIHGANSADMTIVAKD